MDRTINLCTNYGVIEIVNLKRVWINEYFGAYRLMYQDDKYNYNCIYWTCNPNHRYESLKEKLLQAYNNGDAIVEL